jgi:hypothetical protein
MNDSIAISHKLDQIEREMKSMKALLKTLIDKVSQTKETLDDVSRKAMVEEIHAIAKRTNLSEHDAMELANEAVKAVRAHHPDV